MVTLRPVTLENRREIFKLDVTEEQHRFVASNLSSAATAWVLITNGGHPVTFAIYADEVPVGFTLIVYGINSYELPSVAEGNYNILRLMIDQRYQGRGYGREAMRLILDYIRTFPLGPAELVWIQYAADNQVAKKLYASFGFQENGEVAHGMPVAVLPL